MMSSTAGNKGVVLIIVMFVTIFLVMFAAAMFSMTMAHQYNAASFYQNQAALRVAESGIQYALMRLSANKLWAGYEPPGSDFHINKSGVEIIEHYLGSGTGCVEGKVSLGSNTGYFDMYFKKPASESTMAFFKSTTEAGPMPDRIVMSQNNANIGSVNQACYYNDPATPIADRMIPVHSVLLVCRGTVGRTTRTIETLVKPGVDISNSAAWARNSFDVAIRGLNGYDQLVLGLFNEDSPSYVRSGVAMDIGLHPVISGKRNNDYLKTLGNSSGECNNQYTWKNNTAPSHGSENFRVKPGQDNVPVLTLDEVLKQMNAEVDPSGFLKLNTGTYVVMSDPGNPARPIVRRYATDAADPSLLSGTFEDLTDNFKTNYLDKGIMAWDDNRNKLTINKSLQANPTGNLKNLNFISSVKNSVSIQLGADASENNVPSPTYMVNNGGSIHVEGQLTGVGTVICGGDLNMEAESRLLANESNGLSIYCGGTVTINEIKNSPIKTTEQAIQEKIWNFINQNKNNANYQYDPGKIDYDSSAANYNLEENTKTVNMLNNLGYGDGYLIPQSLFTPQEISLLQSTFTLSCPNYTLPTIFAFQNAKGETVMRVDLSPKSAKVGDNFNQMITAAGEYRIWYVEDTLQESEAKSSGVYDEKGRPISYKDSIFKGLIYTCQNFKVNSPNHSFVLEGALIALGGDVNGEKTPTGGNIFVDAADCQLSYNEEYLHMLSGKSKLKILYWINY